MLAAGWRGSLAAGSARNGSAKQAGAARRLVWLASPAYLAQWRNGGSVSSA